MRSPLGTLLNKAPVSYVSRRTTLAFPGMNRADPVGQMAAMGSVGTLFSIVHRLSNSTSQVNWHLWRKSPSGKEEDRQEITSHAALDVWTTPNPFMPRQEFVETFQQHLDLTGEGWWIIARNPRATLPLEIWPARPDRMEPVPDPTEFISSYVYSGPDGERVPLGRDEVIQLRMPNPLDIYRGMGPVQAILADLDATKYSAEWNRNFFLNSAEPGGIIQLDRRLSDSEFEELRSRWAEQHRGVANAHRVAILEAGQWVDRKFTQRDMQFAELRGVSRDVIREAYGMPKFAVGDVDDVNRASAEASATWFAEQLMVPRLERIKAALNSELLPLFGATAEGLEFDYENPVPANREADNAELTAKANAAKTLVDAGYDPQAVLEAVGLPEIVHVGAPAASSLPHPSRRATPPALEREEEPEEEIELEEAAAARLRHLHGRSGADPFGCPACRPAWMAKEDADAEATREDWEERVDDLLAAWEPIAAAQYDELVTQVQEIVDAGHPQDLAEIAVTIDAGAELLTQAMYDQATAAAVRIADLAASQGVSIAPAIPVALDALEEILPIDRMTNALPRPARVLAGLAADLAAGARLTVTNLGKSLASAAAREAMRAWAPGSTGAEVAGRVRDYLEGLTTATLGSDLSAAIWAAENEGRFATLEEAEADGKGATKYVASEIRDTNTCVTPDMLIATRRGPVPADAVTLNDELLTHAGEWRRPSQIVVSVVQEDVAVIAWRSGELRTTADHPVLVQRGRCLRWLGAGEVRAGDFVVSKAGPQDNREVGSLHDRLRDAPDQIAARLQVSGLPPVRLGAEGVPVGAVHFDDQPVIDQEVHGPWSDLDLCPMGGSEGFKEFACGSFDAGFRAAGQVAASAAEPARTLAGSTGRTAEGRAAGVTLHDDRRPATGLGAVAPDLALTVPEVSAASHASSVASPRLVGALPGAVDEPIDMRWADSEASAAPRANLGDPLPLRAHGCPDGRICHLALDRAVRSLAPPLDRGAACHADNRRVVRVISDPGSLGGAGLAERTPDHRPPASRTRSVHGFMLQVVDSVRVELYRGEVYDFSMPHDHTFVASGVVVHNCGPCKRIDGHVYSSLAAAQIDYAFGSYRDCEGGNRCRGTVEPSWR